MTFLAGFSNPPRVSLLSEQTQPRPWQLVAGQAISCFSFLFALHCSHSGASTLLSFTTVGNILLWLSYDRQLKISWGGREIADLKSARIRS